MAKDNKKLVQAITSQEENFAQWYTDICVKAELVEYSSVKGFIILRPYGQAIWELIQKDLDARFKATGHENREKEGYQYHLISLSGEVVTQIKANTPYIVKNPSAPEPPLQAVSIE